jgi:hypothetical protein
MALGVLGFAMAVPAGPAEALEYGAPPWLICADNEQAAELSTPHMPLEPANGATVPAGTPVTFSGESNHALTFSVASSEALLSSPDIDSGTGSQSGSFYRFTSTKATAAPRTIYWTASFTFTPGDCESPSTFTTPVRTLVVAQSEAELAAAKRQQEEAAARKRQEEEAAAAKKEKEDEAVVAGSVSLAGSTIDVQSSGVAQVKLACTGTGACAGKLSLTGEVPLGKGKRAKVKTETIGTAGFSIPADDETKTVKVDLNVAGRALLKTDHGRCSASLAIVELAPGTENTQTKTVRLVRGKPRGSTGK